MTDLIFVHGGGQGGWVWDECIAAIALQVGGAVRCLALDAPGCGGKRGRDTSAMVYDDIIAELIDDVVASGFRDIVLVGHSQAGMVLPRMAERRPDLFARLVYVTCSAPPPGSTTLDVMGTGVHGAFDDCIGWPLDPATTSVAERYRVMFANDMGSAQADAFLARLGSDGWPMVCYGERDWRYDHLADIPALYVQCLRDMSLPPAWQERFARRLKVDGIVRIDAGHQVMNTRPHALAEVLLAAMPDASAT